MLLQEIFDQLRYGELSQTSFGTSGTETLSDTDIDALIAHTRLALSALHKRFPIRQKELLLQLHDNIELYHFGKKYALNSGSSEPVQYIIDSPQNPYEGELLKIERVIDEAEEELTLNLNEDEYSLFTPALNVLQVPYPDGEKTLSVIYRAGHPYIAAGSDPLTTEITLPEAYLEPLLLYIAARYHSTKPLLEGTNQGVMFMQKYELACQQIEDAGLEVTETEEDSRLWRNGWV